jgi:hypothetical protein
MKALIQERLRAKMVRRGPGYDLEDDCERDSDRLLRQAIDVTAYDITSRGEDEETRMSASSRAPSSRRSSSTQPSYPMRLHTHIDPSAYLVPDDRYYAPSASYGSSTSSHGDLARQRYSREQYRDMSSVYDAQQQHTHRRRHQIHHRTREQQPPRYEPPSRGSYSSRQVSQTRASVSPWHRSEYTSVPSKSSSMVRSPFRAARSPVHSPSPRSYRKQDFEYPEDQFDNDEYTRYRRETKSTLPSPRFTVSGNSSHQTQHYQRQRYTWKDQDLDNSNQSAYEVRGPSPTRHGHRDYPSFGAPVRRSSERRSPSNQTESLKSYLDATSPPSRKLQPEEIDLVDITQTAQQPERHSPPALDMEIIEPTTKAKTRTRAWDDILSPESRLAANAFVAKRQRRTEKATPRTMATQRWLEVIDARASRHEAATT